MGTRRIGLLIFATCLCLLVVSNARELEFSRKDEVMYNHTLGLTLAHYAGAAYGLAGQLRTWTCVECLSYYTRGFKIFKVAVDVGQCLQAYVGVATNLNAIIISFRGTEIASIQNWFADISGMPVPLNYPGMTGAMVHKGFFDAYQALRPQILSALQTAKSYGNLPIMVTGHSLGGAMATICALDLAVNLKAENVQVVTFGSPRVGNGAFASYYSKILPNSFRVVNNNDMVPHLPPYSPFLFHHVPREVWLHGMTEKVCDNSGEDPTCSRSVMGSSGGDHVMYYGFIIALELPGSCMGIVDP